MIDTRDDWSSLARLREFATIVNRIKLILLATILAGVAVLALPGPQTSHYTSSPI